MLVLHTKEQNKKEAVNNHPIMMSKFTENLLVGTGTTQWKKYLALMIGILKTDQQTFPMKDWEHFQISLEL